MVSKQNEKGFTLIEIAIWLIVIGLLVVPLIEAYKRQVATEEKSFHLGKFTEIRNKMTKFAVNNNRYPIPADMLAAPEDASFGIEAVSGPPGPPIQPCTSWPTTTGVCRTTAGGSVFIGAVPTEALGLPEEAAFDLWGNKILYAVTQGQTVDLSATAPEVNVMGMDDAGALAGPDQFDYVLLSHGKAGNGAYSSQGNLVSACNAAALEAENCDFDTTFIREDNTTNPIGGAVAKDFGGGIATSYVAGADYYDDYNTAVSGIALDIWFQSLAATDTSVTLTERIGIGTEVPSEKVHVVGDVSALSILTANICRNGGECFDPNLIAGISPDMNCGLNSIPGDEPILWLANSQVYCATPVDGSGNVINNGMPDGGIEFEFPDSAVVGAGNGFGRIDCADSAQLMQGIDADGDPICVTP